MHISLRNLARYKKYLKILKRIILRKPMVLYRILSNSMAIAFLKRKIVRKVEIGVTFDCQCKCDKCSSAFMKNRNRKKLESEEIKKVAEDILALGAIQINFTGGEPLLERQIFEIIKHFQPSRTIISINTNGLLLDEAMIDKLEAAGVDILKISLDSPVVQEHDASRRVEGCFDKVEKALAYIQKRQKILGQISTVCIKENLNSDRIWKLVDMAHRYGALLGLTIPAASGRWMAHEEVLLGEEEKEILKKLIRIPHVIRDTEGAYLRAHCPAGSEEFYVTCYGDVIPCPLIQISFGNVRERRLKEIWEKMQDFNHLKKKQEGCLAGENKEFIERFIYPLAGSCYLPVPFEEHPSREHRQSDPRTIFYNP